MFGCLVFTSTIKAHKTKFDSREIPCVLLGYPIGQKSYKLLNLETNKNFVSKDVTFREKHLPFHITQPVMPSFSNFLPTNTYLDSSLPIELPNALSPFFDPPSPVSLSPYINTPLLIALLFLVPLLIHLLFLLFTITFLLLYRIMFPNLGDLLGLILNQHGYLTMFAPLQPPLLIGAT